MPLKRKELNLIAIKAAIQFYSQDTYRGSYIDLGHGLAVIGSFIAAINLLKI